MKTPLQEILQFEYYSRQMFDSDERVAMALLDYIRVNKEDLLEYEQRIFNTKEKWNKTTETDKENLVIRL